MTLAAGQEHGGGDAVVRAATAVLLDGPAELRERHQDNPVQLLVPLEVIQERRHRFGQLVQQGTVVAQLVGVIVETAEAAAAQAR